MLIDLPPVYSSAPLHPLPSLLSTELQGLSIISLSHSKISKEAMHIHITRVLHREVIFFLLCSIKDLPCNLGFWMVTIFAIIFRSSIRSTLVCVKEAVTLRH